MTCPDIIPGTVTAQPGLLADLVDAVLTDRTPPDWQWQYPVLLSNKPDLCNHHRAGTTVIGESRLIVAMIGYHVLADTLSSDLANQSVVPYPPLPITVTPHVGVEAPAGSGNAYTAVGTYIPAKGSQQDALGVGGITWTTMTDELAESSWSLSFRAGMTIGTVTAPHCVLC